MHRSSRAAAPKQASNRLPIDRWGGPVKPIERGEPVVVSGGRIGAVIEKNLDGFHEARLRGVVDRRRSPAVVSLAGEAFVLDARAMTQERRNKLGVVLASLVPGTRGP